MKMEFDLRDLNRSALERLVKQLIGADGPEEKEIMDKLSDAAKKESEDLADLTEEKRGKASPVDTEDEPRLQKRRPKSKTDD
jgi:division protein CdvB (Snf7/Vps24/ESCRT-III family)